MVARLRRQGDGPPVYGELIKPQSPLDAHMLLLPGEGVSEGLEVGLGLGDGGPIPIRGPLATSGRLVPLWSPLPPRSFGGRYDNISSLLGTTRTDPKAS
ncbi:hypothetical protein EJB05_21836, partial [Eragrostis curvula]